MANDYFKFQRFTVAHDRCAMKVGTDGVLLGAWAAEDGSLVRRLLDVGTGTGLVALMMAQRFPAASVVGIDIDPQAVAQAADNAAASPFSGRVTILQADVNDFRSAPFDAIVCNPPYFTDALRCPDRRRTIARHADTLTLAALARAAVRLLTPEGTLSVVLPADSRRLMTGEALAEGLFLTRACAVRTVPGKPPRRCLLEFRKSPVLQCVETEETLESLPGKRSQWYTRLTHNFYLTT